MNKNELIEYISQLSYIKLKKIEGKKIFVISINNDRYNDAKQFAQQVHGTYQIGYGTSSTVPVVLLNEFVILFKNQYVNKGNQYEKDIYFILTTKNITNYPELQKLFTLKQIDFVDIKEVLATGNKNQKRVIDWDKLPQQLVTIIPPEKTGDIVADIKIILKNNQTINLSLKYGSTLTFINAGVGTPSKDNIKIKKLLEFFELDYDHYIKGFENYTNKNYIVEPKTININQNKIHTFLQHAIGYNYIYLHTQHIFEIDKQKMLLLINNPRNFVVHYPGYARKRVDISFETDRLKLKINIRNKQGGLYPTHIMCDYNIKQGVL